MTEAAGDGFSKYVLIAGTNMTPQKQIFGHNPDDE